MKSLWNDQHAAGYPGELGQRVYSSRLLGGVPELVLHGGGNTSLKISAPGGDVLYIKGSGADLSRVGESDFTPLRLEAARALLEEPDLDNAAMERRLRECRLEPGAPRPSIETLLHASLPRRYVEHTHADAVLAVANTGRGETIVREVFGELAPLVPYRHSGVALARACAGAFRSRGTAATIGLVLRYHGAVAFGDSARESYENMLRLVTLAEDYLISRGAWELPAAALPAAPDPLAVARLRQEVSRAAGFPLVARVERDSLTLAFASRPDLAAISQVGPPTPQHAVFARRVPLIGRDAAAFSAAYRAYLQRHLGDAWRGVLDASPRIALDPEFGMVAFGVDARHAAIAAEIYRQDIAIISRASAHDRYASAPEQAIAAAELEYGGFELRLRARAGKDLPLLGQVAVVAPEAARRDPALAERLLAQGAAVASPAPVIADPGRLGYARDAAPGDVARQAALALGGADLLFADAREPRWRSAFAPLLELSPAAGGRT
ncbi:MAG TPA: class II aldolase/adducin family protein [Burkholderiales bacterium]|nr:class II aldolase/adducin family protein [Burkholderiales bacterium]